ncbi:MAG: serine hydrolase domain-containing protein [Pseudomonadota bacterium]
MYADAEVVTGPAPDYAPQYFADVMQPVLHDLNRVGILGVSMAIDIPCRETIFLSDGYVDLAHSDAMDPSRLFQIGSQTKMFTAAAVILLMREGKLDIKDPVSDYVTGLTGTPDATIEQLLTHTSGVGDSVSVFDPPAKRPNYAVSLDDHLFLAKVEGQQFEPGTDWAYNNLGYIVLGEIVERVSGDDLNEYLHEKLFNPLNMTSTWLGALETFPETQMARGYVRDDTSSEHEDVSAPDLSWASSAGDMVSNLEDMLAWSRALLDPDNPTGLTLADFRHDIVDTGAKGNLETYGLGFMGWNFNGRILWGHGGNIHGYVSLTMLDPDSGIIVAMMTNLKEYSADLMPTLESAFSIALRMGLLVQKFDEQAAQCNHSLTRR